MGNVLSGISQESRCVCVGGHSLLTLIISVWIFLYLKSMILFFFKKTFFIHVSRACGIKQQAGCSRKPGDSGEVLNTIEIVHHRALLNFHCPQWVLHTLEVRWPRSHGLSCSLMMKSLYSSTLFSVLKHWSISRWNSVAIDKREAIKDGLGQLFLHSLNFSESVHKNRRFQFFWNNVLWFFFMCQVSSAEQVCPGPEQRWHCQHGFPPALLKSHHRWPSTYSFPADGLPVVRETLHAQKRTDSAYVSFWSFLSVTVLQKKGLLKHYITM